MAIARRKVKEAEALELVSSWRSSKRSLQDWCATQGIDGRSLRYWVDRLPAAPTAIRMVEFAPPSVRVATSPSLRVVFDEFTIEVPDGFADDTLARVLAVVRSC